MEKFSLRRVALNTDIDVSNSVLSMSEVFSNKAAHLKSLSISLSLFIDALLQQLLVLNPLYRKCLLVPKLILMS